MTDILFPGNVEVIDITDLRADNESNDDFKKIDDDSKVRVTPLGNWLLHIRSGRTFATLTALTIILTASEGWHILGNKHDDSVMHTIIVCAY